MTSLRLICPHCKTPLYFTVAKRTPGMEFHCVACSRTFRYRSDPGPAPMQKTHGAWHKDR